MNNSPYRIVSFELFTSWRQGDVYGSCGFQQPKVKSDTDLTAEMRASCRHPAVQ